MARIDDQMTALVVMTRPQMRAEWRRLFRGQLMPPDIGRDLALRAMTNRLQEKAHGAMLPGVAKELRRLAKRLGEGGALDIGFGQQLKPGTRLVRRWHDKTYHVLVLDTGYQFEDRHYASLTPIARAITGAEWSGPRFFGLTGKGSTNGE